MHLDLDAALRELEREKNPPTIVLHGRTYTCRVTIPMAATAELRAAPERDDDEDAWRLAVIQFMAALLIDEDQDDWLDAIMDRAAFPDELLHLTLDRLAQEYVARPTSPSTDSQPGPGSAGRTTSSTPSPPASATSAA